MKTIFITSFHILISRNIFLTGLTEKLSQRMMRVVILVPHFKKDYFEKTFGGTNIIIEGVDTKLTSRDVFFRKLILSYTPTKALYIKKRAEFFHDGRVLKFVAATAPAFILRGSKFFLKLIRFFDSNFLKDTQNERFGYLFKKYQPALVFSTDVQNELDVDLLQEARRRGVKNISMVRSWDNLTNKGFLRFIPDCLLVNNEIIKGEAVNYNAIPEEKISVIGIPHYDRYVDAKQTLDASGAVLSKSKQEFFVDWGFDTGKPMILFAPIGNRYIRDNTLDKLVLELLSVFDVNILVRLPPADEVPFDGFKSKKAIVAFDRTGVGFDRGGMKTNEVSRDDDDRLIYSVAYSNLLVTGQSTMSIDAALFDKPIINIYFDERPREYWDSVRRYYDYENFHPFRQSGGTVFVRTPDELIQRAEEYLKDPSQNRAGRARLIQEQAQFLDGKSTDRLIDRILSYIQ